MDPDQQAMIRAALQATLEDARLSRAESQALRELLHPITRDDELAFVRNEAFRLADERVHDAPHLVMDWLHRVDKQIDRVRRGPGAPGRMPTVAAAFAPGDGCFALLDQALHAARDRADLCVFTITDDRVTARILQRHADGLPVRVLSDNDKQHDAGSDVQRLVHAGVPVRFDPDRHHMHHKFAVIDRTLLTGSYNWTRGGTRNHENLLATDDPRVVKPYRDEFDKLWKRFEPRP